MFVCSSHKSLDLRGFARLYAYPNTPNLDGSELVILDSGAFGLSMAKRKMDDEHIRSLADYYTLHANGKKNVHCVAPDEFKNPSVSMKRYASFRDGVPESVSIIPVIQFAQRGHVDLFSAKKQIAFYASNDRPSMVCVSNHAFDPAANKPGLVRLTSMVREAFGDVWVHVLGAGFNSLDVARWMKTGVNSMDSISYYTDAQKRVKWVLGSAVVSSSESSFQETAIYNARIAEESARIFEVFP